MEEPERAHSEHIELEKHETASRAETPAIANAVIVNACFGESRTHTDRTEMR